MGLKLLFERNKIDQRDPQVSDRHGKLVDRVAAVIDGGCDTKCQMSWVDRSRQGPRAANGWLPRGAERERKDAGCGRLMLKCDLAMQDVAGKGEWRLLLHNSKKRKRRGRRRVGRRIVGGGPTGAGAGDPGGLMTSIHSVLGAPAPGLPMGALMAERVGPTLSAGIPVWSKR